MIKEILITLEGEDLGEQLENALIETTMPENETFSVMVAMLVKMAREIIDNHPDEKDDAVYQLAEQSEVALEVITNNINKKHNGQKKTKRSTWRA